MGTRRAVDVASVLAGTVGVAAAVRAARIARRDAKCGVLAADAWHRCAERRIRAAARSGRPVSVIVLDVDDFKSVNDRDGHLAGDVVLAGVATCLRDGVRARDAVGRIGGDEFAVVLDAVGAEDAEHIAGRVGRAVRQTCAVTVSYGTATAPRHGTGRHALLGHADSRLYAAKRRRAVSAAGERATPA